MAKKNISEKSENTKNKLVVEEVGFPIGRQNYKLLLIGFAIIVLGFILMLGGGSDNPSEFNYDGLFGFQRRTLAPVIVLAGFAFEIYAIMKKPQEKK
ncbi:MAG: DUF3098 domain-containing protein [Prevotellaceae bacterium]|jgi:hypothetical protein|nr:DUF3098 domain-containing protein [Prevotellaceae bacterium]